LENTLSPSEKKNNYKPMSFGGKILKEKEK
jgi:hypothetical protein